MGKKPKYEYWTDKVTKEIDERVKASPVLQKAVKKNGYIVNDAKTPSGKIHIGSARGWVIHDIIAKSMRDAGMKAKFILGSDDIDPFDSIPVSVDRTKFEKYLGMPLINVPSPDPGYDSFPEYYFNECVEKFDEFKIEAEIYKTSELYISGRFNDAIELVLENAGRIQEIYKKIYGKSVGTGRLPFTPICEKCRKIGTTVAFKWNPGSKTVSYRCEPKLVDWAVGCGHEGEISPFDGNGKMPYKVEWAAKWQVFGILAESAGKDHFTKTGSRAVSIAISSDVFNYPPPWPSTANDIGHGYEFFLVEGKKMSTSKGIGSSFVEMVDSVSPRILRFLMVKTRPEAAIDFKEERMPMIYDDFERHERIYFGFEEAEEREKVNAKRVYELTVVDIPNRKDVENSYIASDTLVHVVRAMPEKNSDDFLADKLKELGVSTKKFALERIKEKIAFLQKWMESYGEEQTEVAKLTQQQRIAVKNLIRAIGQAETEEQLQARIFEIANESGRPGEFFKLIYTILIKSERGPKLGPYIMQIGKQEAVRKLLAV